MSTEGDPVTFSTATEALDAISENSPNPNERPPASDPAAESSWLPINLEAALNGEDMEPRPSLLPRSDGKPLIYRGKYHSLAAEPEAGKTRLGLQIVAETIRTENAVILDFETSGAVTTRGLLDQGANPDDIRRNLSYITPDTPLTDLDWAQFEPVVKDAAFVLIDGVTDVLSLQALNPNDPIEIAKYQAMLPKRIKAFGAAVLEIDHVVKNREGRGRWATGSGHKLAGVDVAFTLSVIKPFGRGVNGSSRLSISKDRPGHLRPLAVNGHKDLALIHYISGEDGALTVRCDPIGPGEHTFRPTVLMEWISRAVEAEPGLTKNGVRDAVDGKNNAKDLALSILVAEGYVTVEVEGQSHRHRSAKPYREEAEE